jgi:hypothetical protein
MSAAGSSTLLWWSEPWMASRRRETSSRWPPEPGGGPGGRIFLVDSYHYERIPDDVQQRFLNDGRCFEVVKRYWQPEELDAIPGWRLRSRVTANRYIIYGSSPRL